MDYSALFKSNTLENAWNGRKMWTVNNGWAVILVKYGFIFRWSIEQFGIWITFLHHHIHVLQTLKNGRIFHALN